MSNYIVNGKYLVYTIDKSIYSLNLETMQEINIYIGDTTNALFVNNNQIVAFNNFGFGKSKNTLIKFDSDSLNIERAVSYENKNIIPITPDSDNKEISFVFNKEKNNTVETNYIQMHITSDKSTNKKYSLPSSNGLNTKENTVATKGYLYTNKDNVLKIYDINGEILDSEIDTTNSFFMPILK